MLLPLRLDLQFSPGGQQRLAWILEWGRGRSDDTVLPAHWKDGAAQTQPILIGWVLGGQEQNPEADWKRAKTVLAPAVAAVGDGPFHQTAPFLFGAAACCLALIFGGPALLISPILYVTVLLLFAARSWRTGARGPAAVARRLASRPFARGNAVALTVAATLAFGWGFGSLYVGATTVNSWTVFLPLFLGLALSRLTTRIPERWAALLWLGIGTILTLWLG